ncbi:MAG TPA: hypothetical protein P5525_18525, partial [Candidatus Paceibacterota bacterium]|nr:hypothetical protein [Candidatus Paceibacterota bacterium]
MSSSPLLRVWASLVVLTGCIVGTAWATELQATRSGDKVVLSWRPNADADFYVQLATNLVDPMGWRIDTNAISVAGETCSVTTVPTGAHRFYRLKAWEVLFDGTSTAVFRGYRKAAFPDAEWTVTASGELKTVFGSPAGHIITTNQYDDFE